MPGGGSKIRSIRSRMSRATTPCNSVIGLIVIAAPSFRVALSCDGLCPISLAEVPLLCSAARHNIGVRAEPSLERCRTLGGFCRHCRLGVVTFSYTDGNGPLPPLTHSGAGSLFPVALAAAHRAERLIR